MSCPVCGALDAGAVCTRCGTDLRALAGKPGEARLEVAVIALPEREHASRKITN